MGRNALGPGWKEHLQISPNVLERFRLDGQVVVITGGAGFLGEIHAEAVCDSGGIVILLDRDEIRLRATRDRLHGAGRAVSIVKADVTSQEDLDSALIEILARHGRIDGLVNNAAINPEVRSDGLAGSNRFEDFPLAQWNAELAVTLSLIHI